MNIMIALKNIKANREKITCEAYVEDCRTPILLSFDRAKNKMDSFQLPNGYAWCASHIHHAEKYFCAADKSELPQERTIMWY